MSTFTRYWLLQIPGCVLLILVLGLAHDRFDLPAWVGGIILLLWVSKDAILYPILKPGYETGVKTGSERLVGLIGIARQDLGPTATFSLTVNSGRPSPTLPTLPFQPALTFGSMRRAGCSSPLPEFKIRTTFAECNSLPFSPPDGRSTR